MTRTIEGLDENGFFLPGTTSLTVTLDIAETSGDASGVTAFAIQERWPAGWTFGSITAPDCTPAGNPANGAASPFDFFYIQIPSFPCQVSYTVNVPASPDLPATVEGEVQYRTTGDQLFSPTVTDTIDVEPLVVEMTRDIVGLDENGFLIPGTTSLTVNVSVDVTSGEASALTAFAIQERWPSGWTFGSLTAPGCSPAGSPAANAESPFDFFYIQIPSFPCDISYTVNVPASPTLPATVEGEAQYRTTGDQLFSDTVVDTLDVEPLIVEMTRDIQGLDEDGFIIPGTTSLTVNVSVDVTSGNASELTAFAVQERWPAGFTFGSLTAPDCTPAGNPAGGATAPFDFFYIQVPSFPCNITYTVNLGSPVLPATIEGEAQYRTTGDQLFSDTVVDVLDERPCLSFTRTAPGNYVAGETVQVTITINSECIDTVTALGHTETVPAGWTFVESGGTNPPSVEPAVGSEGPFDFAYIAVPSFPASFTYTMQVPVDETGDKQITGQVQYRTTGDQLTSLPVTTDIIDQDVEPPVAVCQAFTAQLDANGTVTITADDVDGGSTDNVGIVAKSLSQDTFTCADLGQVTVTLTVEDAAGLSDSCDAVVTVEDTVAPTLTTQPATVTLDDTGNGTLDPASVVADSGDNCDGPGITLSQDAFTCSDLGTVTVTVTAEDNSGNQTSDTADVTVVDGGAPTITLIGDATVTTECGAPYSDAGAMATDACEGDITGSIVVDTSGVDTSVPGNYSVTYNVSDSAGNAAVTVVRTVVVADTTAPVITLVGSDTVTLTCPEDYVELGADVADACDTALQPVIDSSGVNTGVAGTYTVTYDATDASGNQATTVTRTVIVEDNTAPTLTLEGDDNVVVECGSAFDDPGASATDSCDGDITANVVATGTVDTSSPGTYSVTYTVSDAAGNAATPVNRTVEVVDTTAPVLTLEGDNPLAVECGDTFTDPGATATDACEGDVSGSITVDGTVDTAVPGQYTLTYNVSDAAGNAAAPVTRTVDVVDTTAPVITLNGADTVVVTCPEDYQDEGATVTDTCDADVQLVTDNPVNTGVAGTYTVTYTATDSAGNQATPVTRTVIVEDNTAPTLTLEGDATEIVECGNAFDDPGASATDTCDGDLTANVVATGTVDTSTPGNYTLTYNVSDAAGNAATPITRTVTVQDTVPPEVTLNGDSTVTVNCGVDYVDAGATATDACDSDVAVTIDDSAVDTSEQNLTGFTVVITATDDAGNETVVNRTVIVDGDACECANDTEAPVITLQGDAEIALDCRDDFNDPGATATDNCDADVVVTTTGTVDTGVAGTYILTYSAVDAAGNQATPVTRTVTVLDTEAPVIALQGEATVTLECGDDFSDPGATATDNCDTQVNVTTSGTVDTGTPASYVLTYNAVDAAGNAATPVTRTVVVRDTTNPVITVLGDATVTVDCGTTYQDAGATASDACSGDLTSQIQTTGLPINVSAPGTFTVTYTVNDGNGNMAMATRTVNVAGPNCDQCGDNDTTAPVINLRGANPVIIDCETQYNDAGATARDNCSGDLTGQIQVTGLPIETGASGTFTVTYTVTDNNNNTATATRTVRVQGDRCRELECGANDTTPPVITLNGQASVTIECGGSFTDPGASATDNCDASVTVTPSGSVNVNVPGTYTITYNARDSQQNAAAPVTRTVTVRDTTAPVLTLTGNNPLTVDCGTQYTDPGATADDACDDTPTISINDDAVDTSERNLNGFTVTITATDDAGNTATATRLVIVSGDNCEDQACQNDTTPPVLVLNGQSTVTVDCGTDYTDAGATATDNCTANPTVTVDDSQVNTNVENPNGYVVTITATDEAGNSAQVQRLVIVTGPACDDLCQVAAFSITSPAGSTVAYPNRTAGDMVTLDLASEADVLAVAGECDFSVTYTVNGTALPATTDEINGFPASAMVEVGTTVEVVATLSDSVTGEFIIEAFRTVNIVGIIDDDNDGIPNDPFDNLPGDGDSSDSTSQGANCNRVTRLVTVVGQANPGAASVVITLKNPDDPTQTVTATVPRALIQPGETAIILLSLACDPESLIPGDSSELTSDLPSGLIIAGGIFAELSVLVSSDGGATFSEISDDRVAATPITLCMTGLNPTQGLGQTFFSHPTNVTPQFSLQPATGAWDDGSVDNPNVSGGQLCATVSGLSTFGPFEEVKQGATLKVTPNPAYDRVVGIVEVGDTVEAAFTVENVGSGTVTGSASLSGGNGTFSLVGNTDYSLEFGDTQQVRVSFTPAAAQDYTATLTFSGPDGPQSVTLLGSGTSTKAFTFLGCGPAGDNGTSRGDLAVVLLAAAMILGLTQVRRRVRQQ